MRRLRLGRAPRRPLERRSAGLLAVTAAVTVLALTASGCVTVHGETALVPPATEAEAARALADFTSAFNRADKALDPALDADRVTGPFGEINQAGLRARAVLAPDGNTEHKPLELTDARFLLPRKAGWPRWFVADAASNLNTGRRWLLAFVRNGPGQGWEAAHLAVLAGSEVPAFAEEEGYPVPVAADTGALAVAPGKLGAEYVAYLKDGREGPFAAGRHTTEWRAQRRKTAERPGLATQYADRTADQGDFAPLALRTRDGGAFVFFAIRYFERQTAARGYRPKVSADVKALMTGTVKDTVTREWVSGQAALVKPKGADREAVTVVGRLQGVVGAVGS
ncbi:hypothetical protein [Streptomyces sp. NPDC001744]|uniref:hypothetical protein n=1 Tax=Streptomyces sp. NPDC001744 TaxID=3364606 RepID=UPI00368C87ED